MAITYYHRSTDLATGVHVAAGDEFEHSITQGSVATIHSLSNVGGGNDSIAIVFTTVSGEPNDADWDSGTYVCRLDITAAGADMRYGLLNLGASLGHFARVNSDLTSDLETVQQDEAEFSGTGIKIANAAGWNPAAGAVGDRFECCVAQRNVAAMGNQTITIEVDDPGADPGRSIWDGVGGVTVQRTFVGVISSLTGALVKKPLIDRGGVISTITGVLAKKSLANFGGADTPTGLLSKKPLVTFEGSDTPTGVLTTIKKVLLSVAGTIVTIAGALIKKPLITRAGSDTPTGALVRKPLIVRAGSDTPTGLLSKQPQVTFEGSDTPTGSLVVIKKILLSVAGTISTMTGALVKKPLKQMVGIDTPTGSLNQKPAVTFEGTITSTGVLATVKTIVLVVAGAISTITGVLVKKARMTLEGALGESHVLLDGALGTYISTPDTNLLDADRAHVHQSITGWLTNGTNTLEQSTAIDPSSIFPGATQTMKSTFQDDLRIGRSALPLATADPFVFSMWVWIPVGWDGGDIRAGDDGSFVGAIGESNQTASAAITEVWQQIWFKLTPDASDFDGIVVLRIGSAPTAGRFVYFVAGCWRPGSDPTFIPSTRIIGDLDIRWLLAMDDYTPAVTEYLGSKAKDSTTRQWFVEVPPNGRPKMTTSPDGTSASQVAKQSTIAFTTTDGDTLGIKITVDVDNGAGGADYKFFTQPGSIDGAFDQLGTTQTNSTTTSIFNADSEVAIGALFGGTLSPLAGKVFRYELRDGIDGPITAGPDFRNDDQGWSSPPGTDDQGNVWTFNGDAVLIFSTTGSLDKKILLSRGGTVTLSGTLNKIPKVIFEGTVTSIGGLTKKVLKALVGVLTSAGSFATLVIGPTAPVRAYRGATDTDFSRKDPDNFSGGAENSFDRKAF